MIHLLATLALFHKLIIFVVIAVVGFALYAFLYDKYPKTIQTVSDILEDVADGLD